MKLVSVTLAMALLLGATSASLARLGDSCAAASDCNSACCWYGVCRDSFDSCTPQAQEEVLEEYSQNPAVAKINKKFQTFAQEKQKESITGQLRTFIQEDIKKRLNLKQAVSLQEVASETPTTPEAPTVDGNESGVSFGVWFLITFGLLAVFVVAAVVVKRVFFKNDDGYTHMQAAVQSA